ncbi:MAG: Na(+)/H(+) antiporter subunit D [Desulfofustis sp.]|jgi:multicomponent Na+:H+ antiporter subunit D|nr:Na(+)/H(+) antiporter subunit D [Desulfofustis sp.]
MWSSSLPAFVPFFAAAALALVTRGRLRSLLMLAIVTLSGLHLWLLDSEVLVTMSFLDYELLPYRVDKLSIVFGYVFHIAAFISILFALHVKDTMQHAAGLLYAGSAVGALFAGDLLTLFVFWELLAVTSAFLVWAQRSERAYQSGMRYLIIQVLSGVILLAGLLIHLKTTGSLKFDFIGIDHLGGIVMLLAFGIKAAFPVLHSWLTDAYPEATPTGTVFLSAFTTKTAIYVLARGYPGTELLIYVGALMACFPIFYAVIQNDLRRVLSYSLINQLGFMVCGIGIGTALAVNGAVSHAFVHIIYKALLFMSMGAVLFMTGKIKATEVGGLYRTMPKTAILCMIGAASISAFPLFSGFVAKSMIMAAAIEEGHKVIWLVLLLASAGVLKHAGIQIPYFAFFAHDSGLRPSEPPRNMLLAMTIAAVLCLAIGIYPQMLYRLLPFATDFNPYDLSHVVTQTQLLFFAMLAFVYLNLQGIYPAERLAINLDAEWFYRRFLRRVVEKLGRWIRSSDQGIRSTAEQRISRLTAYLAQRHYPTGKGAVIRPTGSMVMYIAILLAAYLWLLLSFPH